MSTSTEQSIPTSRRRVRLAAVMLTGGVVAANVAMASGALAAPGNGSGGPAPKVYVCKFVSIPGVAERLQTGQNPIEVSANSLRGWDGPGLPPVGTEFSDAHHLSVVIGVVGVDDEPSALDCLEDSDEDVVVI